MVPLKAFPTEPDSPGFRPRLGDHLTGLGPTVFTGSRAAALGGEGLAGCGPPCLAGSRAQAQRCPLPSLQYRLSLLLLPRLHTHSNILSRLLVI